MTVAAAAAIIPGARSQTSPGAPSAVIPDQPFTRRVINKPGRAQRSLYPEGSPKKRCKMLKTNTFPADAQPPGEKCGLAAFLDGSPDTS